MRYLVLLCLSFLLFGSCRRDNNANIIPVGERIHHDDFEYSVTNFMITRFLKNGQDTLKAAGMFYIVNFKVENRALRVGHKWDNSIGYMTDESGKKFENMSSVQEYLQKSKPFGYREQYLTPAGSSDSTCLAFDIPLTVTRPYFMVRGQTLMGDIFNAGRFRRCAVKLF